MVRLNRCNQSQGFALTALLLSSVNSFGNCFGIFSKNQVISQQQLGSTSVPDLSEVLNGESCVEVDIVDDIPLSVSDEDLVSSNAPLFSYKKYLTMQVRMPFSTMLIVQYSSSPINVCLSLFQSKRVPVSVRYSEDIHLKPYFLTVAKKIKENYPDVVLDKVVLPKVQTSEGKFTEGLTFEVAVDGKIVVRTPARKSYGIENMHVYVNMQEVDAAILRARRRRRPQTVYGENGEKVRLEVMKHKTVALKRNESG